MDRILWWRSPTLKSVSNFVVKFVWRALHITYKKWSEKIYDKLELKVIICCGDVNVVIWYLRSTDILAKMHGEIRSVVSVTRHSAKNKSCILLFQSRMFTTTSGPSWRKTREVIEPSPWPRRPSTWTQLITQCGEPAARMPHRKQYKIQKMETIFFFLTKHIYICHCVAHGCVQALQKSTVAGIIKGPEGGDEVHHSHHRGATQELPSLVKKQNK